MVHFTLQPEKSAEIRQQAESDDASSAATSQDNAGTAPEDVPKSAEGEQTTKEGSHQRKGEEGITSQDVGKESAQVRFLLDYHLCLCPFSFLHFLLTLLCLFVSSFEHFPTSLSPL